MDAAVAILQPSAEQALAPATVEELREDQRRAYDIITTHLEATLAGKRPDQLRMVLHGEGGTGKSKVIQTVTEFFNHRGVLHLLQKGAYTGIAASVIEGKTLHTMAKISLKAQGLSDHSKQILEEHN